MVYFVLVHTFVSLRVSVSSGILDGLEVAFYKGMDQWLFDRWDEIESLLVIHVKSLSKIRYIFYRNWRFICVGKQGVLKFFLVVILHIWSNNRRLSHNNSCIVTLPLVVLEHRGGPQFLVLVSG
jgi:hypothetical protein